MKAYPPDFQSWSLEKQNAWIAEEARAYRETKGPGERKDFGNGSKVRKGNGYSTGWSDGKDGFIYTAEGGIVKGDPLNMKHAVGLLGVKLRYNEFSGQTQVWGLGKCGGEFHDEDAARLRILVREVHGFYPAKQTFEEVLIDIAHQNTFHPVRDYLDARTWDGTSRIDNWLVRYGGAEDTAFNRAVGRIFLIAGVRRVRKPGVKFDTMLVFESPAQGRNKSQAARILAVREEWFNDNLPIGAKPQEVIEQIGGSWIIEFPELAGIATREIEHVKAFLSRQVDKARRAYGRRLESVQRQSVAIGTTNNPEYMKDDERRFWPVRIDKFDIEALRHDADQLWAEAAHHEALGEQITLQEDLWEEASTVRATRTFENSFEAPLRERFGRSKIIPSEMAWECLGISRTDRQRYGRELSRAMLSMGFERRRAWGNYHGADLKRGDWFYERINVSK